MNVIGYSVYLQLVIGDEQIKQQLQMRFIQWFQRVIGSNGGASSKDNLLINDINSKNSRSNDNNDKNNKSESGESNIYL